MLLFHVDQTDTLYMYIERLSSVVQLHSENVVFSKNLLDMNRTVNLILLGQNTQTEVFEKHEHTKSFS